MRRLVLSLVALAICACGSNPPDVGERSDDAGVIDNGAPDSGDVTADAGPGDEPDAGVEPDGGVDSDAGFSPDAGFDLDAGVVTLSDAGLIPDGGSPSDAGFTPDGGINPDGGIASDAGIADAGSPFVTIPATLPSSRFDSAVASDGQRVYILGGEQAFNAGGTDEIVLFDPSGYSVTVLKEKLPQPLDHAVGVWGNGSAWVFGGRVPSGASNQILRYTPGTPVQVMSAHLPTGRYSQSALWIGQAVYLFGGYDGTYPTTVLRYDPVNDTIGPAGSLPHGAEGGAAYFDGTYAWLLGGKADASSLTQIVRYDPVSQTAITISTLLPYPTWGGAALFDGRRLYLAGGLDANVTYYDTVLAFDPATQLIAVLQKRLPEARNGRAAAWAGDNGYVFGGSLGTYPNFHFTQTILRLKP